MSCDDFNKYLNLDGSYSHILFHFIFLSTISSRFKHVPADCILQDVKIVLPVQSILPY